MTGARPQQDCTFCSIAAGATPAFVWWESPHALAFCDRLPMTPGHTLVIPRRHVQDVWDLTEADAAHWIEAVRQVALLMRERLRPLGLNALNNNGAAADQTQFHIHMHLVPRYGNDQLLRPWERFYSPPSEIRRTYDLLNVSSDASISADGGNSSNSSDGGNGGNSGNSTADSSELRRATQMTPSAMPAERAPK